MPRNPEVYGVDNPLQTINRQPIEAKRAPRTRDYVYPIGQIWVNTATAETWILTRVVSNSASWTVLGKPEILQDGRVTLVAGTASETVNGVKSTDKIIFSRTSVNGSTTIGLLRGFIPSAANTISFESLSTAAPATVVTTDVSIIDYIVYIA